MRTKLEYKEFEAYLVSFRDDLFEWEKGESFQWLFRFANGYGASVIKHYGSYGVNQDKFEVATIKYIGMPSKHERTRFELVNIPGITDFDTVEGYLDNEQVMKMLRKIKNHRVIPIRYIVRTQHLYVQMFEIEDGDITAEESHELAACRRAYEGYIEKMFLDDKETARAYDDLLNQCLVRPGTYKELCDFLRARRYQVLSKDNSSKKEIDECEKESLEAWKEWKTWKE